MLDCDVEGEKGAKTALWSIAEHGIDLRLAWSRTMHEGKYIDRQPESLSDEEWQEIASTL